MNGTEAASAKANGVKRPKKPSRTPYRILEPLLLDLAHENEELSKEVRDQAETIRQLQVSLGIRIGELQRVTSALASIKEFQGLKGALQRIEADIQAIDVRLPRLRDSLAAILWDVRAVLRGSDYRTHRG